MRRHRRDGQQRLLRVISRLVCRELIPRSGGTLLLLQQPSACGVPGGGGGRRRAAEEAKSTDGAGVALPTAAAGARLVGILAAGGLERESVRAPGQDGPESARRGEGGDVGGGKGK